MSDSSYLMIRDCDRYHHLTYLTLLLNNQKFKQTEQERGRSQTDLRDLVHLSYLTGLTNLAELSIMTQSSDAFLPIFRGNALGKQNEKEKDTGL